MNKLLIGIMFIFLLGSCWYDNEEDLFGDVDCPTENLNYADDIREIIEGNQCVGCHNTGSESGGVNLDGYENVKTYANRVSGAVNHENGYVAMPPTGIKIDSCQIAKVKAWIDQGMPQN